MTYENGGLLEHIDVNSKNFYIFGRDQPKVDILINHPSCSRLHCVLQHGFGRKCYIFDLNSAHHTFINKKKVPSNQYVQINVGDFLQFGTSTRTYVLSGPPELFPEEKEVKLNYTRHLSNKTQTNSKQSQSTSFEVNVKHSIKKLNFGKINSDRHSESETKDCPKIRNLMKQLSNKKEKISLLESELANMLLKRKSFEGSVVKKKMSKLEEQLAQFNEDVETLHFEIQETLELNELKKLAKIRKNQTFDDDNDDFYDRTLLQKKKLKSDNSTENNTSKELESLTNHRNSLIIYLENYETKKKNERLGLVLIESDSLDSFMNQMTEKLDDEHICKIRKEIAQIDSKIGNLVQ